MNNKLKIFLAYFKPAYLLKNDFLIPVHAGRNAIKSISRDGFLSKKDVKWLKNNTVGDNIGENISDLNRFWCELTVHYWVWKNYDKIGNPDYIGFMQYRRHFIFDKTKIKHLEQPNYDKCYSMYHINKCGADYYNMIGLNTENITKYLKKYDVILPKISDFSLIGLKSVREDYETRIPGVNGEDLNSFIKFLKQKDKHFGAFFEKAVNKPKKYLYLMYITNKNIFFKFTNYIFPLLLEFSEKLDVSQYSSNGKRTIAYLGESLCGIYWMYMIEKGEIKVKELDIAFLEDSAYIVNKPYLYLKYKIKSWFKHGHKKEEYKQKAKIYKKNKNTIINNTTIIG